MSYESVLGPQKVAFTKSTMSDFFKLNWRDVFNGVIVAVFGVLVGIVQQGNFDVFTADWASIGKMVLNTVVSYLILKLFSTSNGKTFGKI